jgi:peptide/nickel transport system permease protein
MNQNIAALIVRRIAVTALTLLIVSAIIFTITNLLPGDAAQAALGQSATPETVAALRLQFGLDQPAYLRYAHWLFGLLHGNFGVSLSDNLPVSELIEGRLPKSLILAAITTAVSVPIAVSFGILAAVNRNSIASSVSARYRSSRRLNS